MIEPQWWRDHAPTAGLSAWNRAKVMTVGGRFEAVSGVLDSLRMRARNVKRRTWLFVLACVTFFVLLFVSYGVGWIDLPFVPSHRPSPPPPPPPPYPPIPLPGELINWEPPEMDPVVHGVRVSKGINRKPSYELVPFPDSPMILTDKQREEADKRQHHPWLGAVICSPWDIKRRMLIRFTWMRLYQAVPMDQRFVVSNPGPQWTQIIVMENQTYGDMIVLDHIPEDDFTANTVKTIEFYRWLKEKSPRKYEFVSKMDTDLWVNARALYDRHLLPRMDDNLKANVNFTLIGQLYYNGFHKTAFAHGALYTATWDIVELLPVLQDEFHVIAGEDLAMAWLLMKGKQKVTLATLTEAEKFEFDKKDLRPGEVTAWARNTTDVTSQSHALYGKDAIGVHQLKNDNDWLILATCFDENGIKDMPTEPEQVPGPDDPKPGYPRPWHASIPDVYWEVDTDGTMLVNGVWKLERGVGRDMEKSED